MNKSESKYFNTSLLMNQALLILLETKDFEYITVKEICEKAGVNRSTFYLHYENTIDLFNETVERLNKDFTNSFSTKNVSSVIKDGTPNDAIFIKYEFLIPYLEFVKRNKRILKTIHSKPEIFKNDSIYNKLKQEVFYPALNKFNVKENEKPYLLEFFTRGVSGIVNTWIGLDCKDPIEEIAKLIVDCVGC